MPKRSLPNRKLPNRKLIDQLDQAVTQLLATRVVTVATEDPELLPLLHVAAGLRQLPREDFKAKLKADLERRSSMATLAEPVTSLRTVAFSRLSFKNAAKAIDFYKDAFGAKETFRFENEFGIGHAEIMIGDSVIMIANEWPEGGRFSPETTGSSAVSMALQVPDVDGFVEHAVAAGAKLQGEIKDQFYGRRDANLLDPFGYTWSVSTVKEEMSLEEMHRRFNAMMKGQEKKKPAVNPVPKGYTTLTTYLVAQDADGLIDFMTKAFGAEETFRTGPGAEGGLHAEVKIGDIQC
jgi:PhnB protein